MSKTFYRLDLSQSRYIIVAMMCVVISVMANSLLDMPSPDYSGVSEIKGFLYNLFSLMLTTSMVFVGFLGSYHVALWVKVLEEEREGRE